jgi:hypothetical protein
VWGAEAGGEDKQRGSEAGGEDGQRWRGKEGRERVCDIWAQKMVVGMEFEI